ncbi:HD domain-containing protein [Dokdonia ponticola]|uniref:HD domain-containing protein n=1 Tax=Dokdonia ponticola TaxID=2041041 RepID=A0ABV9HXX0_9FLAO
MIKEVEMYCRNLLHTTRCKTLPFHNLTHTEEVVLHVNHICNAMDVDQKDKELVITAAWFHDTGFSKTYKGHEEESKNIAIQFLSELGTEEEVIKNICVCIEATKIPQTPTTTLAEILCDADIFHISTPHFYYRKILLRREWEVYCNMSMTDKEWHELNLDFLKNIHFKSTYGKEILEKGKQENIKKVQQILAYYDRE